MPPQLARPWTPHATDTETSSDEAQQLPYVPGRSGTRRGARPRPGSRRRSWPPAWSARAARRPRRRCRSMARTTNDHPDDQRIEAQVGRGSGRHTGHHPAGARPRERRARRREGRSHGHPMIVAPRARPADTGDHPGKRAGPGPGSDPGRSLMDSRRSDRRQASRRMTTAPPPAPPPAPPSPADPPSTTGAPRATRPRPRRPGPPDPRRSCAAAVPTRCSAASAAAWREYSGIDALLWRVGFVALARARGAGEPRVPVALAAHARRPAGLRPDGVRAPAAQAKPPAPVGPRSPVPGVTIAAAAHRRSGVLALINRLTDWHLRPARRSSAPRCWSSGSAWWSRPSPAAGTARGGLIALGVVLSLALLVASTAARGTACAAASATAPTGRSPRPSVRHVYRSGVGDMTVDLSRRRRQQPRRADRHPSIDARHRRRRPSCCPIDADVRLDGEQRPRRRSTSSARAAIDGRRLPRRRARGSWVDDGQAGVRPRPCNCGVGDVEVSRG